MNRRFFLLAAPAIVAAPSLMRVSGRALHSVEYQGSRLVFLNLRTVSIASFPIRYGAGLYSGYDGYEIVPNEWERAALATRAA